MSTAETPPIPLPGLHAFRIAQPAGLDRLFINPGTVTSPQLTATGPGAERIKILHGPGLGKPQSMTSVSLPAPQETDGLSLHLELPPGYAMDRISLDVPRTHLECEAIKLTNKLFVNAAAVVLRAVTAPAAEIGTAHTLTGEDLQIGGRLFIAGIKKRGLRMPADGKITLRGGSIAEAEIVAPTYAIRLETILLAAGQLACRTLALQPLAGTSDVASALTTLELQNKKWEFRISNRPNGQRASISYADPDPDTPPATALRLGSLPGEELEIAISQRAISYLHLSLGQTAHIVRLFTAPTKEWRRFPSF